MNEKLGFGVLIVLVYGIYMAYTPDPVDGILMSGVIGSLAAGGAYGLKVIHGKKEKL